MIGMSAATLLADEQTEQYGLMRLTHEGHRQEHGQEDAERQVEIPRFPRRGSERDRQKDSDALQD